MTNNLPGMVVILLLGFAIIYILSRIRRIAANVTALDKKYADMAHTADVFDIVNKESVAKSALEPMVRKLCRHTIFQVAAESELRSRKKHRSALKNARVPTHSSPQLSQVGQSQACHESRHQSKTETDTASAAGTTSQEKRKQD